MNIPPDGKYKSGDGWVLIAPVYGPGTERPFYNFTVNRGAVFYDTGISGHGYTGKEQAPVDSVSFRKLERCECCGQLIRITEGAG